jgi:hypothetical protein
MERIFGMSLQEDIVKKYVQCSQHAGSSAMDHPAWCMWSMYRHESNAKYTAGHRKMP